MAWTFHVTANGKRAYVVTTQSTAPGSVPALYEYDLTTKTSRRLCTIEDIDPAFKGYDRHTGYNAWDGQGRFYFASFPSSVKTVRLKAALHIP